jgi:hypothetical protein
MSIEVEQAPQFQITVTPTVISISLASGMAAQGLLGPQGPAGAAGMRTPFSKLSSEQISGLAVVRFVDADHVAPASANVAAHATSIAGLALTATSGAEQSLDILRYGEVADGGWSWTPGLPVFLGANGFLTQTPSAAWAFVLIVGVAISATRICVDPKSPVFQG